MRGDKELVNSVVIVMTDITELSNIQAKLMHTEKMVAVGQMVSGVAHEVNNPLTAIMGFAEGDEVWLAYLATFRQALQELGWTDGHNIRFDTRFTGE